ncbi:hypothetical protein EDC01DRAFT_681714 [Geopyxis carbonaria]|nr:hypothetical protein EDC01DRAFT_681714 [Geopyxis carbonaria]
MAPAPNPTTIVTFKKHIVRHTKKHKKSRIISQAAFNSGGLASGDVFSRGPSQLKRSAQVVRPTTVSTLNRYILGGKSVNNFKRGTPQTEIPALLFNKIQILGALKVDYIAVTLREDGTWASLNLTHDHFVIAGPQATGAMRNEVRDNIICDPETCLCKNRCFCPYPQYFKTYLYCDGTYSQERFHADMDDEVAFAKEGSHNLHLKSCGKSNCGVCCGKSKEDEEDGLVF